MFRHIHKTRHRGQSMLEYLLMMAAVIIVLLFFTRKNGTFDRALTNTLDLNVRHMESAANKILQQ